MNTLFNVGDLNQDGRIDIFTSGRNGRMVWFENRSDGSWQRHIVADVTHQECGGLAYDLTGMAFWTSSTAAMALRTNWPGGKIRRQRRPVERGI